MKIAAIDAGTNSFHMVVARVAVEGGIEIVDRAKEMVRIGDSAFRGGAIAAEAFERGAGALKGFKAIAERHECEAIVAVATSAVREAQNGGEFLRAMKDETGIEVQVISGDEEARLIYLGIRASLDFGGRRALLVDIGGGSVEFIVGDARDLYYRTSRKLGVLRLLAERVTTNPISQEEHTRLVAHCHRMVEEVAPAVRGVGFDFVALASGTANAVAELVASQKSDFKSEQKGDRAGPTPLPPRLRKMAFGDIHALEKLLAGKTAAERALLPGLDPKRVDSIVPGAILIRTILEVFHADEVRFCDGALREGMIADWVARNRPGIQLVEEFPDLRRRSVIGLCRRCGYHRAHAEQTARIALDIFRGTRSLHGLSNADGEMLEFASLLHDVGYHISPKGHHKHGAYLIGSYAFKGFTAEEVRVLAQTVRYHRKSTPRESHEEFTALSQPLRRKVRVLAGILRIADSLDRSFTQLVESVRCEVGEKAVVLRVVAKSDPSLELWGARRKRDLFEETFGVKVKIEVAEG